MIKRWKISNFKSIREPVDLKIEPLTIFCGANSSGKSTVLKSILAVSQSLSSSTSEEPLVLNGRLVNLGPLDEVFHYGYRTDQINLGFSVQVRSSETIAVDAAIEGVEGIKVVRGRRQKRLQARVRSCELRVETPDGDREVIGIRHDPSITRYQLRPDKLDRTTTTLRRQIESGLFDFEIFKPKLWDLLMGQGEERIISASVRNFLPGNVLIQVNTEIRDTVQEIRQITDALLTLRSKRSPRTSDASINWDLVISDRTRSAFSIIEKILRKNSPYRSRMYDDRDSYVDFLRDVAETEEQITIRSFVEQFKQMKGIERSSELDGLVNDLTRRINGVIPELQERMLAGQNRHQMTGLEVVPFPTQYTQTIEQVRQVLGHRIQYLGPLRDDPRVMYAIPQETDRPDVGLKGEYTAAVLDTYAEREVRYPLPPPALPEKFSGEFKQEDGPLSEAVRVWLQRMGLADNIDASEVKKVGYQLSVRPEGLERDLDLLSVGVGISQVLPTIVMALLAPEGSILVFEQPEVHLHPKVQSVLGDFFLGIIACGKQCLVETHSEHLINRIRRRIAESRDGALLSQLRIYFVDREGSASQFRAVEPNEYGAILNWPKGFFDEVEEEASLIMQAAFEKRQERRAQKQSREKE